MWFSIISLVELPLDKICWKSLLRKNPVLIDHWRHLHGIPPWENCAFEHTSRVDEDLSCQGINIHRVPIMRIQQLMDGMNNAQLSVGSNLKWLDRCMCVQPEITAKPIKTFLVWAHFMRIWVKARLSHLGRAIFLSPDIGPWVILLRFKIQVGSTSTRPSSFSTSYICKFSYGAVLCLIPTSGWSVDDSRNRPPQHRLLQAAISILRPLLRLAWKLCWLHQDSLPQGEASSTQLPMATMSHHHSGGEASLRHISLWKLHLSGWCKESEHHDDLRWRSCFSSRPTPEFSNINYNQL